MADESSFHDILTPALQNAANRKLRSGENALMTLAGATGEGLVVTDQRVLILREEMPIVGSDSEVDSFDYSYEQIQTVRVESAIGGGHLNLVLFAPPSDDQQVTLYFPSYDLAKFEACAARIRMLVEQTRGVPVASAADSAPAPPPSESACPKCGSPVTERDFFCYKCGTPQGDVCSYCRTLLPSGALFCTRCGISADRRIPLACTQCGQSIFPTWSFCSHCGQRLGGPSCRQCNAFAQPDWVFCPICGYKHGAAPTRPAAAPDPERPAPAPPTDALKAEQATAEEHNARGMRLYEQEKYEEAAREFEAALTLSPGTPLFHCNLGVVYGEMGRDEEALEEYRVAMRLAPDDPTPHLNLGYFYSERENAEEARRAWENVIALAPNSAEADEARQNLEGLGEV
jgi:RNA polymerase subunit RPABC4/transcription elongation factor Spt4